MKIEAAAPFLEGAHYLDLHDSEVTLWERWPRSSAARCFGAVFKAMQVMGVNLDRRHPVERFLREALVFPLYDAVAHWHAKDLGRQRRRIRSTTREQLQTQSRSIKNRWELTAVAAS
jgi:hypothetical protein